MGGSVDHPHSMKFKYPYASACLTPVVTGISLSLFLLAGTPCQSAQSFFSSPEAPFITAPNESIQRIAISEGSVEAAQSAIDSARQKDSNSVLVLEVGGMLTVGLNPLSLPSKSCLRFSSGSGISAQSSSTAHSLISITNAENVSISSVGTIRATVDGAGKVPVGISVGGSSRIDVDRLLVTHCSGTGIEITGSDALALNQAQSVTRCVLNQNENGIRVDQTAGFNCLDNMFSDNTGTALDLSSLSSIVAGNTFIGNKTAVRSGSDRGVVTRNVFGKNLIAVEFTSTSSNNLLSENRGTTTNLDLLIAGSNNQLFANKLRGTISEGAGGRKSLMIENEGLTLAPTATNVTFFNPPTFANPHSNAVILPGMGRLDITVLGGVKSKKPRVEQKDAAGNVIPMAEGIDTKELPVDIAVVQEAVNKARSENPTNVVVLHLEGDYISKKPGGFVLPDNTCVILAGRILTDLGIPLDPPWQKGAPETQVVLMASNGYSSFSGGKIDGGRQARFGINAGVQAPSIAVIEGVNIASSAHDGIYTKGRKSAGPLYLYRNNVFGAGGRGIWTHVSTTVHIIANTSVGNRQDGIDFDAHGHNNTALFNVSSGNGRHGIFFEEAVHNNLAFANTLAGNGGSGVHVWNEEVKGNTGSNTIVANFCEANRKGISVGGRADDRTASGNLIFNNVCSGNRVDGIASGNSRATNNYFGQCVNYGNMGLDIQTGDSAAAYFFNAVNPEPSAH